MFVLHVRYVRPPADVERLMEAHFAYLERGYAAGRFVVSGRLEPRTGGVILARGPRSELEALVAADPFVVEGVAEYEIVEFEPTRHAAGFEPFLGGQADSAASAGRT